LEEHEFLLHLLEHRHQEMLREIWHTHHGHCRAVLREKEKLLESILNRLQQVPVEHMAG
jgi:hypothetical protein